MRRSLVPCLALLALLAVTGCQSIQVRKTSNVLDFLYPKGTAEIPARDVTLTLPLRIGLAFAPEQAARSNTNLGFPQRVDAPLTETRKQTLLERIAAAFRGRDAIGSVQTIPSSYLQAGGSFDNLDQVARALGIDVIVLLSYDQAQFSDTSEWSLTYFTIVGAFVVKGENNQTQTFVDAAVIDIRSRALLFRAAGNDVRGNESSPVQLATVLRAEGEAGFETATGDLIAKLDGALAEFGKQAVRGTVRGMGTPALEVKPGAEYQGVAKFENGHYVGSAGLAEVALLGLLAAAAWLGRRTA